MISCLAWCSVILIDLGWWNVSKFISLDGVYRVSWYFTVQEILESWSSWVATLWQIEWNVELFGNSSADILSQIRADWIVFSLVVKTCIVISIIIIKWLIAVEIIVGNDFNLEWANYGGSIMNKSMESGARLPGLESTHWLCHTLAVWLWESCLTSLCFGFLSCKTWIIISTSFRVVRT